MIKKSFLSRSPIFQRMLKNTAYLFSATGISAALSLIQGIFIARLLGVDNYGILGTMMLFTGVVNNIASFRMDELVVKFVGHYTEIGDTKRAAAVFKIAALVEVASSFVAYALIWLLAPLGAQFFAKDSALSNWFIIYGVVVLFNLIFESSTGLMQIFDCFRRIAMLNLLQSIVTMVLILAAYLIYIFVPSDVFPIKLSPMMIVVVVYIVSKLVGAVGLTGMALREAQQRWGKGWWLTSLSLLNGQWRELINFAVSTNLSATINLINKDSELLWVAYFRNPTETGYYKLALTLLNMVQMPVSPMANATYPELSREVANKRWKNVKKLLFEGSLVAGGYTLVASLGLLILGQPFIYYAYSAQYLPTYPALIILLAGVLIANTFYWRRPALLAFGLPEYLTKVSFWAAVVKTLGYFFFVPSWGYLGCAVLLSGYNIFTSLINTSKAVITLRRRETAIELSGIS